jgi:rhodanese-related sulfurtransferase
MIGGYIVIALIAVYLLFKLYQNRVVKRGITNARILRKVMRNEGVALTLIDVREPSEYREGHIPSAVNIPHKSLVKKPPKLRKDSLLVVYCRSGSRAMAARSHLRRHGFDRVVNFGGISKWDGELVAGTRPGEIAFETAE